MPPQVIPLDTGGDGFELIALAVALDMARWKSIVGREAPTRQMDLARVQKHVVAALNHLNRFSEMKKLLTATKTSIEKTRDYAEQFRADLALELQALRSAVDEEIAAS